MSFDDIIFDVMPHLIDGTQPTAESILDVLNLIAYSTDGRNWELRLTLPGFDVIAPDTLFSAPQLIPVISSTGEVEHDEIIYRLAKLAAATGLQPHVGKKEQSAVVFGERLGDIGGGSIPNAEALEPWAREKVEQIDCVFFDRHGVPLWGWEVEASTSITTGIDRFLELLKLNPDLARRVVIIVPRKRQKKLAESLASPITLGTRFIWRTSWVTSSTRTSSGSTMHLPGRSQRGRS